jgi:hypothetical protein
MKKYFLPNKKPTVPPPKWGAAKKRNKIDAIQECDPEFRLARRGRRNKGSIVPQTPVTKTCI